MSAKRSCFCVVDILTMVWVTCPLGAPFWPGAFLAEMTSPHIRNTYILSQADQANFLWLINRRDARSSPTEITKTEKHCPAFSSESWDLIWKNKKQLFDLLFFRPSSCNKKPLKPCIDSVHTEICTCMNAEKLPLKSVLYLHLSVVKELEKNPVLAINLKQLKRVALKSVLHAIQR